MGEDRDVEIAVDHEVECAGSGWRSSPAGGVVVPLSSQEGRTLPDAEPVLLIDDSEREPRQIDAVLDQGVRADHDVDLAGARRLEDLAPIGRASNR